MLFPELLQSNFFAGFYLEWQLELTLSPPTFLFLNLDSTQLCLMDIEPGTLEPQLICFSFEF